MLLGSTPRFFGRNVLSKFSSSRCIVRWGDIRRRQKVIDMHDFFNKIQLQQASTEYALFRVSMITTIDLGTAVKHPCHFIMETNTYE